VDWVVRLKSMLLNILFISLNLAAFTAGDHQFSYSGFSDAKLLIDGGTMVTPNSLLELTNGTNQQKGMPSTILR
jgi:hypothetical protein